MDKQARRLDRIRIAAPCSVGWERMVGDDRARFCDQCNLNVYNISSMTRKQAETLIASTEGRLCVRLYKRTDGTVITQDCPVGLRALRRRVSRVAGATFTALMSFCMSIYGQETSRVCTKDAGKLLVNIKKTQADSHNDSGAISGTILDPQGAAVPGARITLIDEKSKEEQALISNDEGRFQFLSLAAGSYRLKIEAAGFKTSIVEHVVAKPNEVNSFDVALEVGDESTELIGVGDFFYIDYSTTSVTTTITDNSFRKLPIQE